MFHRPNSDFFKVLNISRTASLNEIKASYRQLAMKYHPDKAIENRLDVKLAEEKFKFINDAYSTLSDPIKHKEYVTKINANQFGHEEKEVIIQPSLSELLAELKSQLKTSHLDTHENLKTILLYSRDQPTSIKSFIYLIQHLSRTGLTTQDNFEALFKTNLPCYLGDLWKKEYDPREASEIISLAAEAKLTISTTMLSSIWFYPSEILPLIKKIKNDPFLLTQPMFNSICDNYPPEMCNAVSTLMKYKLATETNIHRLNIISKEDSAHSISLIFRRAYAIVSALVNLSNIKEIEQKDFDRVYAIARQPSRDPVLSLDSAFNILRTAKLDSGENKINNIEKIYSIAEKKADSRLKCITGFIDLLSHQKEPNLASQANFNKLCDIGFNIVDEENIFNINYIATCDIPFRKLTQRLFDQLCSAVTHADEMRKGIEKLRTMELLNVQNISQLLTYYRHGSEIAEKIASLNKSDQTGLDNLFKHYLGKDNLACLVRRTPCFIPLADSLPHFGGQTIYLKPDEVFLRLGIQYDENIYANSSATKFEFKENISYHSSSSNLKKQVELSLHTPPLNLALCKMGAAGYGTFATKDMKKESIVCIAAGTIIQDDKVSDEHDQALNFYGANILFSTMHGRGIASFMQHLPKRQQFDEKMSAAVLQRLGLYASEQDLKLTYEMNAANFHTIDAQKSVMTENVRREYLNINGVPIIAFVASRDIKQGDQVGFNYGFQYWLSRGKMPEFFDANGNIISRQLYQRHFGYFNLHDFTYVGSFQPLVDRINSTTESSVILSDYRGVLHTVNVRQLREKLIEVNAISDLQQPEQRPLRTCRV